MTVIRTVEGEKWVEFEKAYRLRRPETVEGVRYEWGRIRDTYVPWILQIDLLTSPEDDSRPAHRIYNVDSLSLSRHLVLEDYDETRDPSTYAGALTMFATALHETRKSRERAARG